jgi:2-methylaconitate cis-trans-isomerase PrpF
VLAAVTVATACVLPGTIADGIAKVADASQTSRWNIPAANSASNWKPINQQHVARRAAAHRPSIMRGEVWSRAL